MGGGPTLGVPSNGRGEGQKEEREHSRGERMRINSSNVGRRGHTGESVVLPGLSKSLLRCVGICPSFEAGDSASNAASPPAP